MFRTSQIRGRPGSNLKTLTWKKVREVFNNNNLTNYDQRQFKNLTTIILSCGRIHCPGWESFKMINRKSLRRWRRTTMHDNDQRV